VFLCAFVCMKVKARMRHESTNLACSHQYICTPEMVLRHPPIHTHPPTTTPTTTPTSTLTLTPTPKHTTGRNTAIADCRTKHLREDECVFTIATMAENVLYSRAHTEIPKKCVFHFLYRICVLTLSSNPHINKRERKYDD